MLSPCALGQAWCKIILPQAVRCPVSPTICGGRWNKGTHHDSLVPTLPVPIHAHTNRTESCTREKARCTLLWSTPRAFLVQRSWQCKALLRQRSRGDKGCIAHNTVLWVHGALQRPLVQLSTPTQSGVCATLWSLTSFVLLNAVAGWSVQNNTCGGSVSYKYAVLFVLHSLVLYYSVGLSREVASLQRSQCRAELSLSLFFSNNTAAFLASIFNSLPQAVCARQPSSRYGSGSSSNTSGTHWLVSRMCSPFAKNSRLISLPPLTLAVTTGGVLANNATCAITVLRNV